MKTLQNNFTTPEQSKRLLELGVPVDSADMLWDGYIDSTQRWTLDPYPRYLEYSYSVEIESGSDLYISHVLPCWSVGRLIEIANICYTSLVKQEYYIKMEDCNIGYMVNLFELAASCMDFSKLEE